MILDRSEGKAFPSRGEWPCRERTGVPLFDGIIETFAPTCWLSPASSVPDRHPRLWSNHHDKRLGQADARQGHIMLCREPHVLLTEGHR